MIWLALLAIPLMALVDRWWGAPRRKLWAKVAAVGLMGLAYLAGGPVAVWLAFALCVGRALGFSKGAATDAGEAWPRACVPVGLAVAVCLIANVSLPLLVIAGLAFAGHAAVTIYLADWYGEREAEARLAGRPINPRDNVRLELARGAAGGVALAAWIISAAALNAF